jgi:ferredoxin
MSVYATYIPILEKVLGNGRKSRLGTLVRRAAKKGRRFVSEATNKTASAPPVGEPSVAFVGADGETIQVATVAPGTSILAIAQKLGIDLDHFCGGKCSCGTCRVKVLNGAHNLSARCASEDLVLGQANVGSGSRLACQAEVNGPVQIEIPRWF